MKQSKEMMYTNLEWEEILDNLDILSKVHFVLSISNKALIDENIVAALLGLDIETLNKVVDENIYEFVDDLHVYFDNEVEYLTEDMMINPIDVSTRKIKYTKRAILRLCMFLKYSPVASHVRTRLIEIK